MSACIHGEVCREYLRQRRGIICQTCPTGCRFYEPKERTCHAVVRPDGAGAFVVCCSECGHDLGGKWEDARIAQIVASNQHRVIKFCESCGAKVVEE